MTGPLTTHQSPVSTTLKTTTDVGWIYPTSPLISTTWQRKCQGNYQEFRRPGRQQAANRRISAETSFLDSLFVEVNPEFMHPGGKSNPVSVDKTEVTEKVLVR
jgi:hypothetical protein